MIPALLVFATLLGLSGSALLAFWWSAQHGEFERPQDAARAILDADDGEGSDEFPSNAS
jgi:cbb3-type cytochrome oxidase maturation protein